MKQPNVVQCWWCYRAITTHQEKTAADGVELTAEQVQRLDGVTPATGERHDEANMATTDPRHGAS